MINFSSFRQNYTLDTNIRVNPHPAVYQASDSIWPALVHCETRIAISREIVNCKWQLESNFLLTDPRTGLNDLAACSCDTDSADSVEQIQ